MPAFPQVVPATVKDMDVCYNIRETENNKLRKVTNSNKSQYLIK
jgi:hypothetical protein